MGAQQPAIGVSSTADFYPSPDDAPDGCITWTFICSKSVPICAGVFAVHFVRNLTADELKGRSYAAALSESSPLHAFITQIAALKINGASMSGDDAVSALSGLIEEARALIRQANGEAVGAPQSSTQGN